MINKQVEIIFFINNHRPYHD